MSCLFGMPGTSCARLAKLGPYLANLLVQYVVHQVQLAHEVQLVSEIHETKANFVGGARSLHLNSVETLPALHL